jgi:hypothetical protein
MRCQRHRSGLVAVAFAAVLSFATVADASVPLLWGFGGVRDYGTHCLSPNDDGSSAVIDLTPAFPSGLRFFGGTYTTGYVNTNGNITFYGAEPVYTPNAFPVAAHPMIAAYWADVDLRPMTDSDLDPFMGTCRGYDMATGSPGDGPCQNPDHNGAWWYLEPDRMVITWDNTGYYDCHLDLVMDFQMILTAVEGCGGTAGDFDVEFRFNRCEWTTGDASGGSGGFGGTPAQVGFDAGDGTNFVQIAGSMTGDINNIACNESNVGEPGRWVFQIRGGTVICPDAGEPCTIAGAVGVCAEGRTNCVGAGTECIADLEPSEERCNALRRDLRGVRDLRPRRLPHAVLGVRLPGGPDLRGRRPVHRRGLRGRRLRSGHALRGRSLRRGLRRHRLSRRHPVPRRQLHRPVRGADLRRVHGLRRRLVPDALRLVRLSRGVHLHGGRPMSLRRLRCRDLRRRLLLQRRCLPGFVRRCGLPRRHGV